MTTIRDLIFSNPLIDQNRPALISGDTQMSFHDFRNAVAGVARALQADGVSKGDRVCVLAETVPEYIISYFGIVSIGAVYVPLSWRMHHSEHVILMNNSEPKVLIASAAFNETIVAAKTSVPSLKRVVVIGGSVGDCTEFDNWMSPGELPTGCVPTPDDPAAIVYTSGTTSLPKGVLLTHSNIVFDLKNVHGYAKTDSSSIVVHVAPLYHQTFVHILVHITYGGAVVLVKKFNPVEVMKQIEKHKATYIFLAPTMLYEIMDSPDFTKFNLSSLQTIVYGAAPIAGPRLRQAVELLGTKLVQAYGLSEATSHATYLDKDDHLIAEGSIGKPVQGIKLRVVNADGTDSTLGQIGEIIIRGPSVMTGYWRDEQATENTIKDGWLYSGDLARVDERGFIYIVDRSKDLVISGGVNIYPRDIEDALAAHPGIAECAAFGVPDSYWGEALVAAVVARPGFLLDPVDILAFCRTRLGGYQIPKRIEVVSQLPKNPTGKLLKRVLRDQFSSTVV